MMTNDPRRLARMVAALVFAACLPFSGVAAQSEAPAAPLSQGDEPLIVVITPTPSDAPVEDIRTGYVVREDGSIFALSDWILARLDNPGAINPDGITSLLPDRAPPIDEWAVSQVLVMIDGKSRKMSVARAAAAMGLDLSRRIPSSGDRVGIYNVGLDLSEYDLGNFTLGTLNLSGRRPAVRF